MTFRFDARTIHLVSLEFAGIRLMKLPRSVILFPAAIMFVFQLGQTSGMSAQTVDKEALWQAIDKFFADQQTLSFVRVEEQSRPLDSEEITDEISWYGEGGRLMRVYRKAPLRSEKKGDRKRFYISEHVYREDATWSVGYNKEEGKPVVSPEHNVRVVVDRRRPEVDSSTRTSFGVLHLLTGEEGVDLLDKQTRAKFELKGDGASPVLRFSPRDGEDVELRFRQDPTGWVFNGFRISSDTSDDPRFASETRISKDYRYNDDGVLVESVNEYVTQWHLDKMPDFFRKKFPDGVSRTEHRKRITRIDEWRPETIPLQFKEIPVPNGFPVRVAGEPGVKYEYRDGEAVLVVSEKAQSLIDRMRKCHSVEQIGNGEYWKDVLSESVGGHAARGGRRSSDEEVGGYCGLYSIAAAAAVLGKEVPLPKLLNDKYVKSALGSTGAELLSAIEDVSLHGQLLFHANGAFLRSRRRPVLLHLGQNHSSGGPQHWVLFLGLDDNDDAVILDIPHSVVSVPIEVLRTYWDGTAVIVSNEPIESGPTWQARAVGLIPLGVTFGLLGIGLVFGQKFGMVGGNGRRALVRGGSLLLICCAVGATLWTMLAPSSYFRNPLASRIAETKVNEPRGNEPDESIEEIADLDRLKGPGILLVDARKPIDYSRSAIPGAVNCPVYPSLGDLLIVSERAKDATEVIVYCQSSQCHWSHAVARKLKKLGIERVGVYTPGWRGFINATREQR